MSAKECYLLLDNLDFCSVNAHPDRPANWSWAVQNIDDNGGVLIPEDLLPESRIENPEFIDAEVAIKHLVELIRKHEQEQKDLRQYIKRGKMQTEAERLAAMCRDMDNTTCPRPTAPEQCPGCYCEEVTPEHWLEILRKESDEEQSKTQNG